MPKVCFQPVVLLYAKSSSLNSNAKCLAKIENPFSYHKTNTFKGRAIIPQKSKEFQERRNEKMKDNVFLCISADAGDFLKEVDVCRAL